MNNTASAKPAYDALVAHHARIYHLEHLQALASWDRLTHMPAGGAGARAAAQAALAGLIKQLQDEPALAEQLARAEHEPLQGEAALNFARMKQAARIERALPQALVERRELCAGASMQAWGRARQDNDWAPFALAWKPLVAAARESAQRIGDALSLSRTDALLERFDPGLRMARVRPLFASVQAWLPGLLRDARQRQEAAPAPIDPVGPFPLVAQKALCERVMTLLGFDFAGGRLDTTLHPFSGGVPEDVRLATRYSEAAFLPGLIGTIHETGHARYQQNLPREWLGQPLAGPHSAALHEGQALSYERQLAPELAFCTLLAPLLSEAFGEQPAFAADNLVALMRRVRPGRVRVAADELSYPLHVILRVQIEQALIEGEIEVDEVQVRWSRDMASLLDVDPAGPFGEGPLQDPHWAQGMFGYFPSYLLGAMVAAQCFARLRSEVRDLDTRVAAGDCAAVGEWLRTNVWQQGARHDLDPLLQRATGAPLSDCALRAHLERRYGHVG